MKKLLPLLLNPLYLFLSAPAVYAAVATDTGGGGTGLSGSTNTAVDIGGQVKGFFGFTCITQFVFRIVDAALIGAGILVLVLFVWGGLEWMTSGGDKGKTETARSRLTNAVIGVAIVAVSYAFWKIILTFFGLNAPDICSANPLK